MSAPELFEGLAGLLALGLLGYLGVALLFPERLP